MKRSIRAVCAAVVLFCCALSARADNSKVQVGVIIPLSGEAAGIGRAIENGITLGLEALPPDVRDRIQVNYEDDGLITKNSVEAFYKLKSTGKVDVLINPSSGTALALSALAEKARIPFLAIASDAKIVAGKKYVFNFWLTPETEARAMLDEVARRGYKKIARITTQHNGTVAVRDALDTAGSEGFSYVLDDQFPIDMTDFSSYLTKLRGAKDLDGIMIILLPPQCGEFARQARQMGITAPLFGSEVFEDATQVKLSGGALIGQWYVNTDDPDNSFLDAYRKRFPDASLFAASNGHDAALLIGKALQQGYSAPTFNEFLEKLKDFKGALGVYSATGDHRFSIPAAVKVVTKDGFEKIR